MRLVYSRKFDRTSLVCAAPFLLAPLLLISLVSVPSCKSAGEDSRECNVNADCASSNCLSTGVCGEDKRECSVNADCASNNCLSTGVCAKPDKDAGIDSGDLDSSVPDSSKPDSDASSGCSPNNDDTITAAESPFKAGNVATYRISTAVTAFDSKGVCSAGSCLWDLVDLKTGTTTETEVTTDALKDQWFATESEFADATYASKTGTYTCTYPAAVQNQFGIFKMTPDALLMLGLVSETKAEGTKLVYDPPVVVIKFPVTMGSKWTVDTRAKGQICSSLAAMPYNIHQVFDNTVDAAGQVITPYGTFKKVLRVNTLMTRSASVLGDYQIVTATTQRSHTFLSECFTTVATVSAKEKVTTEEFTEATEVRRLSNNP